LPDQTPFQSAFEELRNKRNANPIQDAFQQARRRKREAQLVGGEAGSAGEFGLQAGQAAGSLASEALDLATSPSVLFGGNIGADIVRNRPVMAKLAEEIGGGGVLTGTELQDVSILSEKKQKKRAAGSVVGEFMYGGIKATTVAVADTARGLSLALAPTTPVEAFARGAQISQEPQINTISSNLGSAIAQAPVNIATFSAAAAIGQPHLAMAQFFAQGAGAGAYQYEKAFVEGELKDQTQSTPFSNSDKYLSALLSGGIEVATEYTGLKIESAIAKTVYQRTLGSPAKQIAKSVKEAQRIARQKSDPLKYATWEVFKGLAKGAATEFGEEAIGTVASEQGANLLTGMKVPTIKETAYNAMVAGMYGAVGGMAGTATAFPIQAAQMNAERNRLNQSLRSSNTEYSDPTFWDKVAPTKVSAMQGMTQEERVAETESSREAALQARVSFATQRNNMTELLQQQAVVSAANKKARRNKNETLITKTAADLADLQTRITEGTAALDVLAADMSSAELAYLAADAVTQRNVPQKLMTLNEVLEANNVSPAVQADLTPEDAIAGNELAKLGYDVAYFTSDDDVRVGFFDPSAPNTIFIKTGSTNAAESIGVGYEEALHGIQFTDGKLWAKLRLIHDEASSLEAATEYFNEKALGNPEDIAAQAALDLIQSGQQTPLTPEQAVAKRYGGALAIAEGTANDLRAGIQTIYQNGQAPNLLNRVILRMGLKGRQAATAFKIRNEMLKNSTRVTSGVKSGQTVLGQTITEAKSGLRASVELRQAANEQVAKDKVAYDEVKKARSASSVSARQYSRIPANQNVRDIAKGYVEENATRFGLKFDSTGDNERVGVDQKVGIALGRIADVAESTPNDPDVLKSYDALSKEIKAQYLFILSKGYKLTPWGGSTGFYEDTPRKSPSEFMAEDVRDNKNLYYFKTIQDGSVSFGLTGGEDNVHPLLKSAGIPIADSEGKMHDQTYNDLLRVVHDFFGHAKEGHQFGPVGEENAWRQHVRMFSPLARAAMTAETRMQNSWFNYGPHIARANGSIPIEGESDFVPPQKRNFMDQKVFLAPEWATQMDTKIPTGLSARSRSATKIATDALNIDLLKKPRLLLQAAGIEDRRIPSFLAGAKAARNLQMKRVSPSEFSKSLKQSIGASTLTPYTIEELSDQKVFELYKIPSLEIGFAIKRVVEPTFDGYEVVGLFNNEKGISDVVAPVLLFAASQHTDKPLRLDCFDVGLKDGVDGTGKLPSLYKRYGFVKTRVDPFDKTQGTPQQLKVQEEYWQSAAGGGLVFVKDATGAIINYPKAWYGEIKLTKKQRDDIGRMGLKVLDDDPTIIQIIAHELAIGVERSVDGFRQQRIAERQSVRRQVSATNVGDSGALSQVAGRRGPTTGTPAKPVRITDLGRELDSALSRATPEQVGVMLSAANLNMLFTDKDLTKSQAALDKAEKLVEKTNSAYQKAMGNKPRTKDQKRIYNRDVLKPLRDKTNTAISERDALKSIMNDSLGLLEMLGITKVEKQMNVADVQERFDTFAQSIIGYTQDVLRKPAVAAQFQDVIAHSLATDIMFALEKGKRGGETSADWYDGMVKEMLKIVSKYMPNVSNDKSVEHMIFTLALAVTSNGERVNNNMVLAREVALYFAKTLKLMFPPNVSANRVSAMEKTFKGVNLLRMAMDGYNIDPKKDTSWIELREFMLQRGTFKELNQKLRDLKEKVKDRLPEIKQLKSIKDFASDTGYMSSILGPKIGSFFNNLNGFFDTVTTDVWWTRTFARIVGRLQSDDFTAIKSSFEKFYEFAKSPDGRNMHGLTLEIIEDTDGLMEWAEGVEKNYLAEPKNVKNKKGELKRRAKDEVEVAATRYTKSVKAGAAAPENNGMRSFMRKCLRDALDIVEAKTGVRVSPATAQALLWYTEKELYNALGAGDIAVGQDYVAAATNAFAKDAVLTNQGDGSLIAANNLINRVYPKTRSGKGLSARRRVIARQKKLSTFNLSQWINSQKDNANLTEADVQKLKDEFPVPELISVFDNFGRLAIHHARQDANRFISYDINPNTMQSIGLLADIDKEYLSFIERLPKNVSDLKDAFIGSMINLTPSNYQKSVIQIQDTLNALNDSVMKLQMYFYPRTEILEKGQIRFIGRRQDQYEIQGIGNNDRMLSSLEYAHKEQKSIVENKYTVANNEQQDNIGIDYQVYENPDQSFEYLARYVNKIHGKYLDTQNEKDKSEENVTIEMAFRFGANQEIELNPDKYFTTPPTIYEYKVHQYEMLSELENKNKEIDRQYIAIRTEQDAAAAASVGGEMLEREIAERAERNKRLVALENDFQTNKDFVRDIDNNIKKADRVRDRIRSQILNYVGMIDNNARQLEALKQQASSQKEFEKRFTEMWKVATRVTAPFNVNEGHTDELGNKILDVYEPDGYEWLVGTDENGNFNFTRSLPTETTNTKIQSTREDRKVKIKLPIASVLDKFPDSLASDKAMLWFGNKNIGSEQLALAGLYDLIKDSPVVTRDQLKNALYVPTLYLEKRSKYISYATIGPTDSSSGQGTDGSNQMNYSENLYIYGGIIGQYDEPHFGVAVPYFSITSDIKYRNIKMLALHTIQSKLSAQLYNESGEIFKSKADDAGISDTDELKFWTPKRGMIRNSELVLPKNFTENDVAIALKSFGNVFELSDGRMNRQVFLKFGDNYIPIKLQFANENTFANNIVRSGAFPSQFANEIGQEITYVKDPASSTGSKLVPLFLLQEREMIMSQQKVQVQFETLMGIAGDAEYIAKFIHGFQSQLAGMGTQLLSTATDTPFISEVSKKGEVPKQSRAWKDFLIRELLDRAVTEGYGGMILPDAEVLSRIVGMPLEAAKQLYEVEIPSMLKKLGVLEATQPMIRTPDGEETGGKTLFYTPQTNPSNKFPFAYSERHRTDLSAHFNMAEQNLKLALQINQQSNRLVEDDLFEPFVQKIQALVMGNTRSRFVSLKSKYMFTAALSEVLKDPNKNLAASQIGEYVISERDATNFNRVAAWDILGLEDLEEETYLRDLSDISGMEEFEPQEKDIRGNWLMHMTLDNKYVRVQRITNDSFSPDSKAFPPQYIQTRVLLDVLDMAFKSTRGVEMIMEEWIEEFNANEGYTEDDFDPDNSKNIMNAQNPMFFFSEEFIQKRLQLIKEGKNYSMSARKRMTSAQRIAYESARGSGQIAGMMRGRQEGMREQAVADKTKEMITRRVMRDKFALRVAALNERIESAAESNDVLRERIKTLKESERLNRADAKESARESARAKVMSAWFAGLQKGSATGWNAAKKEMVDIRREAKEVINLLPMSMRAKYLTALTEMKTAVQIDKISHRVVQDLATADAIDVVTQINSMRKRLKKTGLRNETREDVEQILNAAGALLTSGKKRLLPFTSTADLRNRTVSATTLLEQAFARYENEREEFRDARSDRKEELAQDTELLAGTMQTMEGKDPSDLASKAPQQSVREKMTMARQNMDGYTLMHVLEGGETGVLGKMWNGLIAGKNAMILAKRKLDNKVEAMIRRAGYDGWDGYIARAVGLYGDATAETIEVTIGGLRQKITVDQMLHIAALDQDTVDLLRDEATPEDPASPIVFATNRFQDPIFLTQQEHREILNNTTPQQKELIDGLKNLLDTDVQPILFEIHFQMNGKQPPKVAGYFPRQRLGDEIAESVVDPNMQPSQVVTAMLSNAGMLQTRVKSRAALVIGGLMRTFDSHLEESNRLIHLSKPLRYALSLLRTRAVRSNIERILGDGGNDNFRKLIMNGVGLSGRPTGDMIEKINSNISGAVITLNPKTWIRQIGGMFRLMPEFETTSWLAGMAKTVGLMPFDRTEQIRSIEDSNGYFYERHRRSQVGLFANIIGDPRTGTEQWSNALAAVGRALSMAGQDVAGGKFRKAADDVRQGLSGIGKIMRSVDFALRAIDRQIMLVAYNSARDQITKMNPSIAEADLNTAAATLAENAFRRTQNVSDTMDDTMFAAKGKFDRGLGRLMFPFSSDPLKAYNQVRRAIRTGDAQTIAKVTTAVGGNIMASAAVNPLWTLVFAALGSAFGGGDDDPVDEEITRRLMAAKMKTGFIKRISSEGLSVAFGYAGMLAEAIIDPVLGFTNPHFASDAGEPMAIQAFGDMASELAQGRYMAATSTASQMLGVPVAAPIRSITSATTEMKPTDATLLTELRRYKREGTITQQQANRLLVLEARERLRKLREGK
jgi:hypothetical protein